MQLSASCNIALGRQNFSRVFNLADIVFKHWPTECLFIFYRQWAIFRRFFL